MNNFHEFYIDLKESDILHLQDGIDEERNSFKNINIWEIILGYSKEPLQEFKKKLNSFGIFFKNEYEYKDCQILLQRIKEERRIERRFLTRDHQVVNSISDLDDDKKSIEEALLPQVSMRNHMTKRVNKAQEKKPEGSKSQSNIPQIILANIISAYVIFILLVCGINGYVIFLIGYFSTRTPEKFKEALLFGISVVGTIIFFICDFFQIRRTIEHFITNMNLN